MEQLPPLSPAMPDVAADAVFPGVHAIGRTGLDEVADALVLDCSVFEMSESLFDALRGHPDHHALPVVIVQASLLLGQTILIESGLSYLGLGAQPPLPSWGNMVVEGRQFLATAWWIAAFPGLAIFVTVLGFNLFGDGLRDAFDPALRGSA